MGEQREDLRYCVNSEIEGELRVGVNQIPRPAVGVEVTSHEDNGSKAEAASPLQLTSLSIPNEDRAISRGITYETQCSRIGPWFGFHL